MLSLTRLLRSSLLVALPALAIACGDQTSNKAPIIDSVEAPLTVVPENGVYQIPVTVLFHDNDGEAITRLHYRLPPNVEGMIDVVAPNPDSESALITITFPVAALEETDHTGPEARHDDPKAEDSKLPTAKHDNGRHHARSLELSVVDVRGAESVVESSSVTLD